MDMATHRPGCDRTHSDGRGAPCNTRGPLDRLPAPDALTFLELHLILAALPESAHVERGIVTDAAAKRAAWLAGPLTVEGARS
jgi:hypothetical protein